MREFEKPYVHNLKDPNFDSFRPVGKSYSENIKEHKEHSSFCDSLKVNPPDEEEARKEARKEAERKYTEERNGRGERP